MLSSVAKPATPCLARIGSLRKINCVLQNALVEKGAWWAAMWHVG
ncbi:MAG: hypothetical protein U9N41_05420 [Euryarchaeota archaeon]|nr:hypothetical protein [Euryarchaeota archaeon]